MGSCPALQLKNLSSEKEYRRPRTRAQFRVKDIPETETVYSHSESESESVYLDIPEESLEFTTRVVSEARPIHHSES